MKKTTSQKKTLKQKDKQKNDQVENLESKLNSATCNIDNDVNRAELKKVIRSAPKEEQEVYLKFLEEGFNRD